MKTAWFSAAVLLLLLPPSQVAAQQREAKKTEVHGHTMYTLLPPGAIPAIFNPEFIPISEADSLFYPDEPLMVVAGGGQAKGYSTWHLDRHEIVNDHAGGRAIAVTW
jgi:hypothetical protein